MSVQIQIFIVLQQTKHHYHYQNQSLKVQRRPQKIKKKTKMMSNSSIENYIQKIQSLLRSDNNDKKQKQMSSIIEQGYENEELFDMSIEMFKETLEVDELQIQELARDQRFLAYIKCIQQMSLSLSHKFIQRQHDYKSQIQTLQFKNSTLSEQITQLIKENQDMNELVEYYVSQRKIYDEELNKSQHQIERGKNLIINQHKTKELLIGENQQLVNTNEELTKQNSKLHGDIEKLTKQLIEIQSIQKQLKIQLTQNKIKIQYSQQQLNNLKQQHDILLKEHQALNILLQEKDFLLGNKLDQQVKEDIPLSAEHNYPYFARSIEVVREEKYEHSHDVNSGSNSFAEKDYCDDKLVLKDIEEQYILQKRAFLLDFNNKSITHSEEQHDFTDSVELELIEAPYGASESDPEQHTIKSSEKNDVKLRPMKSDRKKIDTDEKEQVDNVTKSMIKTQHGSTKQQKKELLKQPKTPKFKQPLQKLVLSTIKRTYFESQDKTSKSIARQKNVSAEHKYPLKSNTSVILNPRKDHHESSHFAPNTKPPRRLTQLHHTLSSVDDYCQTDFQPNENYVNLTRQLIINKRLIEDLKIQNRSVRKKVQQELQKRTQAQIEYEQIIEGFRSQLERVSSLLQYSKQEVKNFYSQLVEERALTQSYHDQIQQMQQRLQQQKRSYEKVVSELKQLCIQQVQKHRMMFQEKYKQVTTYMITMQQQMRQMERIVSNRNSSLGSSYNNEGGESEESNGKSEDDKRLGSSHNLDQELICDKHSAQQQSQYQQQSQLYLNKQSPQQQQSHQPINSARSQRPLFPKQVKHTSHNASRQYSVIIPYLSHGDSKSTSMLIDQELQMDTQERLIHIQDYGRDVLEEQEQEERGYFEYEEDGLFTRRERLRKEQQMMMNVIVELVEFGVQTELIEFQQQQQLQQQQGEQQLESMTTLMYSQNYLVEEKEGQQLGSMQLTTLVQMKSLEHSKIKHVYQVQQRRQIQISKNEIKEKLQRLGYYQQVYQLHINSSSDDGYNEDLQRQQQQLSQSNVIVKMIANNENIQLQQQQQQSTIYFTQSYHITTKTHFYNQPSTAEISITDNLNNQSINHQLEQQQHQPQLKQESQQRQYQQQQYHSLHKELNIVPMTINLNLLEIIKPIDKVSTSTETYPVRQMIIQKVQHVTIVYHHNKTITQQASTQCSQQSSTISMVETSAQWEQQSSTYKKVLVQSYVQSQSLKVISIEVQSLPLYMIQTSVQSQSLHLTSTQIQSQSPLLTPAYTQSQAVHILQASTQYYPVPLTQSQTQYQQVQLRETFTQSQQPLPMISIYTQSYSSPVVQSYSQSQTLVVTSTYTQSICVPLFNIGIQSQSSWFKLSTISAFTQSQLSSFISTSTIGTNVQKMLSSSSMSLITAFDININQASNRRPELKQTFVQYERVEMEQVEVQAEVLDEEKQQQEQKQEMCHADSQTETEINKKLSINGKVIELAIIDYIVIKQSRETQCIIKQYNDIQLQTTTTSLPMKQCQVQTLQSISTQEQQPIYQLHNQTYTQTESQQFITHDNESQTIKELIQSKDQQTQTIQIVSDEINDMGEIEVQTESIKKKDAYTGQQFVKREQSYTQTIDSYIITNNNRIFPTTALTITPKSPKTQHNQQISSQKDTSMQSFSRHERQQQMLQQSTYIDQWLNEWSESMDLGQGFIQLVKRKLVIIMDNIKQLEIARSGGKKRTVEEREIQCMSDHHYHDMATTIKQCHQQPPISAAFFEGTVRQLKTSITTNASTSLSLSLQSPLLLTKQSNGFILPQQSKRISNFEQIRQQLKEEGKQQNQVPNKKTVIIPKINVQNNFLVQTIISDHRSNYSGSVNRSQKQQQKEQQQQYQCLDLIQRRYQEGKQKELQQERQLEISHSYTEHQQKHQSQQQLNSCQQPLDDRRKHIKPLLSTSILQSKPQQLDHLITDNQFIKLARQFKLRKMHVKQMSLNQINFTIQHLNIYQSLMKINNNITKLQINNLQISQLLIIVVSNGTNQLSSYCQSQQQKNYPKLSNDVFALCQGKLLSLNNYYSFNTQKLIQQLNNQHLLILGNQQILLSESQLKFRMNNKMNYFAGRYPYGMTYKDIYYIKGLTYKVKSIFKYIIK